MMTLFTPQVTHPTISYYSNEKKSAIAPKVTDKGAGAVQKQIDETFTSTITGVGLDVLQSLSKYMDQANVQDMFAQLQTNAQQAAGDLTAAASVVDAFADMSGSLNEVLTSSADLFAKAGSGTGNGVTALNDSSKNLKNLDAGLQDLSSGIGAALDSGTAGFDAVEAQLDQTFSALGGDAGQISDSLTGLSGQVADEVTRYQSLRDSLAGIRDALGPVAGDTPLLGRAIGQLDEVISLQQSLQNKLKTAAAKLTETTDGVNSGKQEIGSVIAAGKETITQLRTEYDQNVKSGAADLFGSLDEISGTAKDLIGQLENGGSAIQNLADSSITDLKDLQRILTDTSKLLTDTAGDITNLTAAVQGIGSSGDAQTLEQLLKDNTAQLSGFLASPVTLKTTELYPTENYGSAMAPFYSTLSIWVGGIILVAMLQVSLSDQRRRELNIQKPHQEYLGRWLLFLILGLLQSTLICLGDLYYLQIQCRHPFYFLLAGWISSIVYVNIIYTLTVSFGDIGKALCVLLLVMQVAGTGGTFPIEVAPDIFQKIYPFLPFTHSMTAMRECVAGFYGNTYWLSLGRLLLFMAASLCLGLLLRRPIIKANHSLMKRLEETKVM